jgi:hypothetical protein
MRLLIASLAALAAVAFAAPSYAQDDTQTAPVPTPTAKPKLGTAAYCQSLKSASSRSSCLKKVSAKSAPKAPTTTTAAAKKTKKATPTPAAAAKQPDVGQLAPPSATPAPAPAGGTVAVPPLPQKTI